MKKRIVCFLLCLLFVTFSCRIEAEETDDMVLTTVAENNFAVDAKSAVLMEVSTGEVLFCQNEKEPLPPASVTKIMTLLLVMEAIDTGAVQWDEKVSISQEAASMGGSQVFLEEGESMTVEDLVKCTVIASANDAAYALAELVSGSESIFVNRMNEYAARLGLSSTHFENVTGLDDTVDNHVTSALDIAIMTKELLKHPKILEYSWLWQDTIRNGEFTLTNTNRLVRFYPGCNGLKTGSTEKAGYCVSATATKGNMTLIAVVIGASSRDVRNNVARSLLDYGFSSYEVYEVKQQDVENVDVRSGVQDAVTLYSPEVRLLVKKGTAQNIEIQYDIPFYLTAPIEKGKAYGSVSYILQNEVLKTENLYVDADIPQITYFQMFIRYVQLLFTGRNR